MRLAIIAAVAAACTQAPLPPPTPGPPESAHRLAGFVVGESFEPLATMECPWGGGCIGRAEVAGVEGFLRVRPCGGFVRTVRFMRGSSDDEATVPLGLGWTPLPLFGLSTHTDAAEAMVKALAHAGYSKSKPEATEDEGVGTTETKWTHAAGRELLVREVAGGPKTPFRFLVVHTPIPEEPCTQGL